MLWSTQPWTGLISYYTGLSDSRKRTNAYALVLNNDISVHYQSGLYTSSIKVPMNQPGVSVYLLDSQPELTASRSFATDVMFKDGKMTGDLFAKVPDDIKVLGAMYVATPYFGVNAGADIKVKFTLPSDTSRFKTKFHLAVHRKFPYFQQDWKRVGVPSSGGSDKSPKDLTSFEKTIFIQKDLQSITNATIGTGEFDVPNDVYEDGSIVAVYLVSTGFLNWKTDGGFSVEVMSSSFNVENAVAVCPPPSPSTAPSLTKESGNGNEPCTLYESRSIFKGKAYIVFEHSDVSNNNKPENGLYSIQYVAFERGWFVRVVRGLFYTTSLVMFVSVFGACCCGFTFVDGVRVGRKKVKGVWREWREKRAARNAGRVAGVGAGAEGQPLLATGGHEEEDD
ncbi:hypothetical protein HDU76_010048 [Blyttiomyces sp. JEL0837]|nr:hypothetical protein HDU76_010048 [Blyttiomyces sp. JEL0837]